MCVIFVLFVSQQMEISDVADEGIKISLKIHHGTYHPCHMGFPPLYFTHDHHFNHLWCVCIFSFCEPPNQSIFSFCEPSVKPPLSRIEIAINICEPLIKPPLLSKHHSKQHQPSPTTQKCKYPNPSPPCANTHTLLYSSCGEILKSISVYKAKHTEIPKAKPNSIFLVIAEKRNAMRPLFL